MSQRIQLPWGYVDFGPPGYDNEVLIVSTVDDPPKVRMAAPFGGGLGALSYNRLRQDGRLEEVVLLQGKVDERYRPPEQGGTSTNGTELVGELRLDLRRPSRAGDTDDKRMIPIFQMRHDGIVFHVPVGLASQRVSRFYSDNGRYCFNVQGDEGGQIVRYDTWKPGTSEPEPDESKWTGARVL